VQQLFSWLPENHWLAALSIVGVVVVLVAIRDIMQTKRTIQHNFPVVGHFRYWLESIGPELRQYWVADDREETPFNRSERSWVYASAKNQNNNTGFGTTEIIYEVGYPIIKHAVFPFPEEQFKGFGGDKSAIPCLKVVGASHGRRKAFRPASVINVSAMSFGSLGSRAVTAINKGAARAGILQNTGEGGISPYHKSGGDIIYQLGTGYFGSRGPDGLFSLDALAKRVEENPQIRAIELKLSQGAKPGKGGILPGKKVTAEIAAIRGVEIGKDCISPNYHRAFSNVTEMVELIEAIAERTGLPVGIKSAIGGMEFWEELAVYMVQHRKRGPDYIAIDGGEGGTGAAPLAFADHVALPFKIGFARVYNLFLNAGLSERIVWVGAGKLGFPDRAILAFAMGCDMIYVAREAMLAIGCIQARRCHTDHCPAGVATQNWWLQSGFNIEDKAQRLERYVRSFRKEVLNITHASGYRHPGEYSSDDVEFSTGVNQFTTLTDVVGYRKKTVPYLKELETTPLTNAPLAQQNKAGTGAVGSDAARAG
jgi:glutamate synthase (ferredoxin)